MSGKDLLGAREDFFQLGIKGLLRNEADEVLLLRTAPDRGSFWDLPGGRIQVGSTVQETLRREISEETGIDRFSVQAHLAMFAVAGRIQYEQRDVGLILSVYDLGVSGQPIVRLSHEHDQFQWSNLAEAAKLLEAKFPASFTDVVAALAK